MDRTSLFVLFSFLLLPFQAGASERVSTACPSELELVTEAIADSLPVCFATVPLAPQTGVRLKALTENETNWLVENCLTKILLEKGCYVVRTSREANPAVPLSYEYILSYRIADLKFEYWHPKASIFKKRSIRRRMRLDCFFFLSEAQSPIVLWSKWMQIQRQDLVPAGAEEALKDEIFSDRTILRDKNRWIEILVVVGVIGSMIYTLF